MEILKYLLLKIVRVCNQFRVLLQKTIKFIT